MSLSIKTRKNGNAVVLDVAGRLTVLEPALRETIRTRVEAGDFYFVLNLADLTYLDSCGLGQMVSCFTTVRGRGGDIVLLNPSHKAMEVIEVTRLNTVFEVLSDEAAAVRAATRPRTASA